MRLIWLLQFDILDVCGEKILAIYSTALTSIGVFAQAFSQIFTAGFSDLRTILIMNSA